MSIRENIARSIAQYKLSHRLSMEELSSKLCVAKSTLVQYLNGAGNPRADTLELLAEKCGISLIELISAQPPGWEAAEIIVLAARELTSLPPERQKQGIQLFLDIAALFASEEPT